MESNTKNVIFSEMKLSEMQEVNGGDALLAALIAAGVTLFGTGFAGGIAVGLNRVNN